jgi:hypothetical protein
VHFQAKDITKVEGNGQKQQKCSGKTINPQYKQKLEGSLPTSEAKHGSAQNVKNR